MRPPGQPCPPPGGTLAPVERRGPERARGFGPAGCADPRPRAGPGSCRGLRVRRPPLRSRSSRPRWMSSSSRACSLSLCLVSRGGSWMVSSASMPAWSWRPRSISASNSAPNSSDMLRIQSHSSETMTPPIAP